MGSRYYDEKEAEIAPGKISQELRAALNIADNDVPIWIYRMRALGYPPGWLSKAIVDTSDIFDTDEPPKDGNSNKRKDAPSEDNVQYDHSKLIEYPGFNMPLPEGANDYHYYHNMPPMLPHQQLDYAKKTMSAFKPAPIPAKRHRAASPNSSTANESTESLNARDKDKSAASVDSETPASPDPEGSDDSSDKQQDDANNPDKTTTSEMSAQAIIDRSTSSITGEIKLVSKGSPMPKPSMRVPLERFSEGVVGELLYHENLPNSTGQFDNIRGILNTMRQSRGETEASFASSTGSKNDVNDASADHSSSR